MILNDGVEDTISFGVAYRTRVALVNGIGYALWHTDIALLDEVSSGVTDKCFEVNQVLKDYFAAEFPSTLLQ
jgi:hypothetical protein